MDANLMEIKKKHRDFFKTFITEFSKNSISNTYSLKSVE